MAAKTRSADGHDTVIAYDNQFMTFPAGYPLRHVVQAPFGRRAWAEVGYALATLLVTVVGVAYTAVTVEQGFLLALSAAGMRKLAAANRFLARELIGEDIAAPPPLGLTPIFKVRTPAGERLAAAVKDAGGKARVWETRPGVTVRGLSPAQIAELATGAKIAIDGIEPLNAALNWYHTRVRDLAAWRARAYFAFKLPLAVAGLAVAVACWAGGAFALAFPAF